MTSAEENNEQYETLQQDITEAFEKVLSKYENSQILKWVALVEVITLEDGDRGLWSLASQNAKSWEVKGMLNHALDLERARNFVDVLKEDE